jgi:hypothetical protein
LIHGQNSDPEKIVVPFSDPAKPGTVQVKLFQEDVTIGAYNGKEVVVRVRDRSRINSPRRQNPEAEGLRRLTPAGVGISENNNIVSVQNGSFEGTDLEIQAPSPLTSGWTPHSAELSELPALPPISKRQISPAAYR